MNFIKKVITRFYPSTYSKEDRYNFFDIGFHGDLYLISLVDTLIKDTSMFIETGSNVASTLAYVASKYPNISCFSCEPDKKAFLSAKKNTEYLDNVEIFFETSQCFLRRIFKDQNLKQENTLFWLDAHGYGFDWPLQEEIDIITSSLDRSCILIDDFLVPSSNYFQYDEYNGQVCSLEYIRPFLNKKNEYLIYYPDYSEKTSDYHPLKGWGLIMFGYDKFEFPADVMQNIFQYSLK